MKRAQRSGGIGRKAQLLDAEEAAFAQWLAASQNLQRERNRRERQRLKWRATVALRSRRFRDPAPEWGPFTNVKNESQHPGNYWLLPRVPVWG